MSILRVISRPAEENPPRFDRGISRSCCRNLFGPIDHAQLRKELEYELRRIADEKKRKWNFDFVKVKPLQGNFKWERIIDGETNSVKTNIETNLTEPRDIRSLPKVVTNTTSINANSNHESNFFETPERYIIKQRRKSPRITDYIRARKACSTSRKIKFSKSKEGATKSKSKVFKSVQTEHQGGERQSTIEQYTLKLRPRPRLTHGTRR